METNTVRRAIVSGVLVCLMSGTGIGIAASAEAKPTPTVNVAAAVDATGAEQGAVAWAQARVGQDIYDGLCLAFVVDAYSQGGGVDIGSAPAAVDYWNGHGDLQHPGDTNAPYGALVFWGATSANPYGHVGISLSDGTVISTYERSNHTVHVFSMAERNAAGYPYLGWMQVA